MGLGLVLKDLEGQFVCVLSEALEAKRSRRRDGDDGIHHGMDGVATREGEA